MTECRNRHLFRNQQCWPAGAKDSSFGGGLECVVLRLKAHHNKIMVATMTSDGISKRRRETLDFSRSE
jgi:hypothetical protein